MMGVAIVAGLFKLDPVPDRFAARCASVEDLIRRIRQGGPLETELLTQLNLDGIRMARLALMLRDEKTKKKKETTT